MPALRLGFGLVRMQAAIAAAQERVVTECDWLTCADPQLMLSFLRDRGAGDRKLRLFACASCRTAWGFVEDERSREVHTKPAKRPTLVEGA